MAALEKYKDEIEELEQDVHKKRNNLLKAQKDHVVKVLCVRLELKRLKKEQNDMASQRNALQKEYEDRMKGLFEEHKPRMDFGLGRIEFLERELNQPEEVYAFDSDDDDGYVSEEI